MQDSDDKQFEDVISFRRSLDEETDRGCALMAAAFLDSELNGLLRLLLVEDPRVADETLGQGKPIGTFSARIDLCYMLGLISPLSRKDFHLIRKIRNTFGHTHLPKTFSDQEIANRCKELTHHLRDEAASPRTLFVSSAVGLLAIIHSAMDKRQRISMRQNPDLDRARFGAAQLARALKNDGRKG